MKSIITTLLFITTISIFAQVPQAINYQAVARDASNNLLVNKNIGIRISILSGSTSGTNVYSETHIATTNASGIFSIEIGRGNIVSGNLPNIQWYAQPHFAKIEIDANGGTNYQLVGISQFLSVPYALFAENTAMIFRPDRIVKGSNNNDTTIMYRSEIGNIDYISSCIIDWIGGEPENITVTSTGFNSYIYPIGIAFPYTINANQFENRSSCPNFSIEIDTLTPVGVYPITITGTNPRGRQKSKTSYIQIKDCIYSTEDGYVGIYTGNINFMGLSQNPDTTTISNPINNDNKLSFTSKLFQIGNIELVKDINNTYLKNGYAMNNVTITTTSLGTLTIQNALVNISVKVNCQLPNNIDVKYVFTSGTTNTGLSLGGLQFNGTLHK